MDRYPALLYPLVESAIPKSVLRAWNRSQTGKKIEKDLSKLMWFVRYRVEYEERIHNLTNSIASKDGLCNISSKPTEAWDFEESSASSEEEVTEQCRICGDFFKDCIPVSQSYLKDNKATLAFNDATVQLDFLDDSLPNTVCRHCDAKLQEMSDFVTAVKAVQNNLIDASSEAIETLIVKTEDDEEEESTNHDDEDTRCSIDDITIGETVNVQNNYNHNRNNDHDIHDKTNQSALNKSNMAAEDSDCEIIEIKYMIEESTDHNAEETRHSIDGVTIGETVNDQNNYTHKRKSGHDIHDNTNKVKLKKSKTKEVEDSDSEIIEIKEVVEESTDHDAEETRHNIDDVTIGETVHDQNNYTHKRKSGHDIHDNTNKVKLKKSKTKEVEDSDSEIIEIKEVVEESTDHDAEETRHNIDDVTIGETVHDQNNYTHKRKSGHDIHDNTNKVKLKKSETKEVDDSDSEIIEIKEMVEEITDHDAEETRHNIDDVTIGEAVNDPDNYTHKRKSDHNIHDKTNKAAIKKCKTKEVEDSDSEIIEIKEEMVGDEDDADNLIMFVLNDFNNPDTRENLDSDDGEE